MRIIRHHDTMGATKYAADQAGGIYHEIDGDIFGNYSVSDRPAHMAKILAPIAPVNIICIGLNYRRHAEEGNQKPPAYPVVFFKSVASVQNPGDAIEIPTHLPSNSVDYECELAVVIGKKCKNVRKADALKYVLGYTCGNDVSARDWQREKGGSQWCRAKTFDTFCPLGPVLVTADEIVNPNALGIKTIINGETLQDWNTNDMIFDVPTLIEFLSGSTTLLAGTIIMTGTPHGVGFARKPPRWLKPGDAVHVEIEKIGTLINPVELEKA